MCRFFCFLLPVLVNKDEYNILFVSKHGPDQNTHPWPLVTSPMMPSTSGHPSLSCSALFWRIWRTHSSWRWRTSAWVIAHNCCSGDSSCTCSICENQMAATWKPVHCTLEHHMAAGSRVGVCRHGMRPSLADSRPLSVTHSAAAAAGVWLAAIYKWKALTFTF